MLNTTEMLEPVIKWSGSKRVVAPQLASLFPKADRYFEPFVGGGAMLPFQPGSSAIAGDVIAELIELWMAIREKPDVVANEYEHRWQRLQREGHAAYYDIRHSFNTTRNAYDLLFLTRTCVNGLIRFNSNREFNNSLHHTRPGIAPSRLRSVIRQWSQYIQCVDFVVADYHETLARARSHDLVFLDPPYAGTKGRYMPEEFDVQEFCAELDRLNRVGVRWILTFDGTAGKRAYAAIIPSDLYQVRLSIGTGNSPFTKLMRAGIDVVSESVYLNFEPPSKLLKAVSQHGQLQERSLLDFNVQQGRLFD